MAEKTAWLLCDRRCPRFSQGDNASSRSAAHYSSSTQEQSGKQWAIAPPHSSPTKAIPARGRHSPPPSTNPILSGPLLLARPAKLNPRPLPPATAVHFLHYLHSSCNSWVWLWAVDPFRRSAAAGKGHSLSPHPFLKNQHPAVRRSAFGWRCANW